ncbi:MAG: bifunctional 5,10-methylenetetrahydrofolate dehydrogenase/5,10-methenyltetrahydrofolate cyclohydrolase [Erysipelotrichaceae bacterium]|nr:bifunctional 5,10-methylenetetrahydrofolate dehydrogenase/5,10-methenyltetrahydrofolate cyclohydrolase [Erysipelotrichaceae bacterium]
MAIRLDGKVASLNIKEQLKKEFLSLDRKACLAIIHFNDLASASYLKGRIKLAEELNVEIKEIAIKEDSRQEEIISLIKSLNDDKSVDGIMIDRPLPKKYDENYVLSFINEKKDVDGYTYNNLGRLLTNSACYPSATPKAAIRLLEYYNIDVSSKDVLVIGRSVNVGKPLALMLLNKNATVTIAHSKTKNIKEKCQKADIIFLAVGKANFLKSEDVNENSIIIDIGINYDENNKLVGDASKLCYEIVKMYSPVPGGVGVMTNIVLMENLLMAYKNNE